MSLDCQLCNELWTTQMRSAIQSERMWPRKAVPFNAINIQMSFPCPLYWQIQCSCVTRYVYVLYKELPSLNPLNPELNPICYLLALLGAHHFLHISRIRVKLLTFRLLMSHIYMEHPFLMFLDHTRRSTVGRTPLDEWSAHRWDLYLTTQHSQQTHPCPWWDSNPRSQQASGHRLTP